MFNTKEDQINFLDSLFTQKDFYFLNSLEEEIELIQTQIQKQEQKREIIVEAINYCENNLKNLNQDNISPFSNLLEKIKEAFVLVNSNIKSLLALKKDLTDINLGIVNLLVSIESNPNNRQTYMFQADDLSNAISDYSNYSVNIKTEISNNDLKLNQFLSSNEFKNIFSGISNKPADFYDNFQDTNFNTKVEKNVTNISDDSENTYNSNILRISEKENKVYLPYTNSEIKFDLTQFPDDYRSYEDVIKKEFILPLAHYMKHPVLSRFRETYSLVRDREAKSIMEAIKYSMNLMFTYELNPTIIAACKTQEQLENYLECLKNNELDNFKDFEIKFEISPL